MVPTDLSSPLALRPREAAKALGISARHLWQLTNDGHIPCVRVGSARRGTELSFEMSTMQAGRIVCGVMQGDSRPDQFIPYLVDLFMDADRSPRHLLRFCRDQSGGSGCGQRHDDRTGAANAAMTIDHG